MAHRFIADGDYVAVEARGDNVTKAGVRYDNEYCLVYRLEGGKIKEIREYCDSALSREGARTISGIAKAGGLTISVLIPGHALMREPEIRRL